MVQFLVIELCINNAIVKVKNLAVPIEGCNPGGEIASWKALQMETAEATT